MDTGLQFHKDYISMVADPIRCRHWYWVRRLFGRRGLCRKCEAVIERITREILCKMEDDFMAKVSAEVGAYDLRWRQNGPSGSCPTSKDCSGVNVKGNKLAQRGTNA